MTISPPGSLAVSLAAAGVLVLCGSAAAAEVTPILTYTGDPFAVVGGDGPRGSTYVHAATGGLDAKLGRGWSLQAVGAWTAGRSLSDEKIGDTAGVQGAFNSGDALWLYKLSLTAKSDAGQIAFGRLSSGDYFGAIDPMAQFVNSAFSSNGGAISVNDAGRATSPASSWGAAGSWTMTPAVTLRGGAFLSNPDRLTGDKHGTDFTFRPSEGVIGFGEVDLAAGGDWKIGAGGWTDSAPFTTFDGRAVRDDHGLYAFANGPLWHIGKDRHLDGFAMVQGAPQQDRNLQPFIVLAGVTLTGPLASRPADTLAIGLQSGRYSEDSGLSGRETAYEINYRLAVGDHWGLRPDLQYIVDPGGRDGDALVAGLQIEYDIGS